MKTILNVLLLIATAAVAYVTYQSVNKPIQFDKERSSRETHIIQRLMDIRKAQIAYKTQNGVHAANFQELIDFLKNGRIPTILKEGELTEEQLEDGGLTEEKAVQIIEKAKKTGNWKDAEKKGLVYGENKYFRRDTSWVNAGKKLLGDSYEIDRLAYVPGTDKTFAMDTASIRTASGFDIAVFEVKVPYEDYLSDLSRTQLKNLKDRAEKMEKYPGLKVGSLDEINNYAGNWESEY